MRQTDPGSEVPRSRWSERSSSLTLQTGLNRVLHDGQEGSVPQPLWDFGAEGKQTSSLLSQASIMEPTSDHADFWHCSNQPQRALILSQDWHCAKRCAKSDLNDSYSCMELFSQSRKQQEHSRRKEKRTKQWLLPYRHPFEGLWCCQAALCERGDAAWRGGGHCLSAPGRMLWISA